MPLASPGKQRSCADDATNMVPKHAVVGVSGPYHYSDRMDHEDTNDPGKVWSLSCLSLLDKIGVPVWLAASSFTEDRMRQAVTCLKFEVYLPCKVGIKPHSP